MVKAQIPSKLSQNNHEIKRTPAQSVDESALLVALVAMLVIALTVLGLLVGVVIMIFGVLATGLWVAGISVVFGVVSGIILSNN